MLIILNDSLAYEGIFFTDMYFLSYEKICSRYSFIVLLTENEFTKINCSWTVFYTHIPVYLLNVYTSIYMPTDTTDKIVVENALANLRRNTEKMFVAKK